MNSNTATITAKVQPGVVSSTYPNAQSTSAWKPNPIVFGAGTSAGSIDSTLQTQVNATTSGASLQLNGGGLTDPLGGTFSVVRIDALAITNSGTSFVTIGGQFFANSMTAGASLSIPLQPGGIFQLSPGATGAGLSTGSGTNSTIFFTAFGGSSVLQVYAAGRSV